MKPTAPPLNAIQRQSGDGPKYLSLDVAQAGATFTGTPIDEDALAINPTIRCPGGFVVDVEVKATHPYTLDGEEAAQGWQLKCASSDKRRSAVQFLSGARRATHRATHRAAASVCTRVAPPTEVLP